jgi:drug/metabolite transporter (DMT)-like permease
MQASLPALALVLNALVWGVAWWPLRQLQAYGVHPLWATALIFTAVFAALLLAYFESWRGFVRHPQLWLLALASGLTNVGFNWAVTVGDVVRVVLLFYLMPAWSVLIAWLMLGEKPSGASLARLALAMAGVLIVLKTPDSPWPIPQSMADWLSLMGGFSFAATNALLRKLNHSSNGSRMLAMFGGGALLATGTAALSTGIGLTPGPPAPSGAWIGVAVLISLAYFLSNLALQYGASRLRASTTSLIMLSEVVFASVSSVIAGAGELSGRALFGGGLILLAALLAAGSSEAT